MDSIFFMKWKSGDETTERGYNFSYDGLDRLTAATYGEGTAITTNLNRFNETVTYNDKMGNIGTLQRRGNLNGVDSYGLMDNLTCTYAGNRLTKVTDAVTTPITYQGAFHFVDRANVANEYTYDYNGNLTKDLNRNITSITYNELNLPNVITFSGNRSIIYGYDAAGNKLSVAYLSDGEPTKMEYAGNRVYNNNMMTTLLTDEGYIDTGTTPVYHYYLKDHQGNNRVVVNQAGTVEEVNHYYPFGGVFSELARPSIQRYKYNGKELDRKFDLDMYDYGARHYDPALGRWFTVDPMGEKYLSFSPYVYVGNNPVNITDPNGMDWNITRRTDSLGNDHYDITVNGVLYNNSYSRNINMEKLLNAIVNNVNNTFTFSGDG
ncbi:RHS repeat-associated core domain-containing protein, partial [Proteiniphilum sp.]|uniref:RHS repeat-associated core domain-containing protein n=1 Tax=Proteiniphilum sp. TaxID=1926877 RepID=UPI002B1F2B1C